MIEAHEHSKDITKITWIGLFINLGLFILKVVLGFLGHSQAVIADAVHSLSDALTDLAVLFGVKYWNLPADDEHPYGHKRIETVVTLFIGLLLAFVGYEIIVKAITSIPNANPEKSLWIAAIGPFLTIVLKESLFQWNVAVGKKTHSSAVIANAWHHRSDAFSSIPAFIAVIVASFSPTYYFVDYIGAIVVSVFIFKVSFDIIRPGFLEIIGKGVSEKEKEQILNVALKSEGVKDVHKLRTRTMGGNYFIDLHVLVDGSLSVKKGHDIAAAVKHRILSNIPSAVDVIVHIEPFEEPYISED